MKNLNRKTCLSVVCLTLVVVIMFTFLTSCSKKIDNSLSPENYTCEFIITREVGDTLYVNVFNDFTMCPGMAGYAKYMSESEEYVPLRNFEVVVRTFAVSKSEVYYDMVIRHKESGDIIYKYVLDESNNYSYTTLDGTETYKIIRPIYTAAKYMEEMKGKSYKKNNTKFPEYDLVCEEDSKYETTKYAYGVTLDENENIIKLMFAELFVYPGLKESYISGIGTQIVFGIEFSFSNYGTTQKP